MARQNPINRVTDAPTRIRELEARIAQLEVREFPSSSGGGSTDQVTTFGPDEEWRIGGTVLDLNFAGTAYNTAAKLADVGVKMSDAHSPFPSHEILHGDSGQFTLGTATGWSHAAGNGWQPTGVSVGTGAAILVPVIGNHDWELEVDFTVPGERASDESNYMFLGIYVPNKKRLPAYQWNYSYSSQYNHANTYRLHGNGTAYGLIFNGSTESGTGTYTMGIRTKNGCIGGYHDDVDAWRNNEGTAEPLGPWTHAIVWVEARPGTTWFDPFYIDRIQLKYTT